MLREDVRDAVAAGQFQVYCAKSVDEALELLTGYSASSIDAQVLSRLDELDELARQFSRGTVKRRWQRWRLKAVAPQDPRSHRLARCQSGKPGDPGEHRQAAGPRSVGPATGGPASAACGGPAIHHRNRTLTAAKSAACCATTCHERHSLVSTDTRRLLKELASRDQVDLVLEHAAGNRLHAALAHGRRPGYIFSRPASAGNNLQQGLPCRARLSARLGLVLAPTGTGQRCSGDCRALLQKSGLVGDDYVMSSGALDRKQLDSLYQPGQQDARPGQSAPRPCRPSAHWSGNPPTTCCCCPGTACKALHRKHWRLRSTRPVARYWCPNRTLGNQRAAPDFRTDKGVDRCARIMYPLVENHARNHSTRCAELPWVKLSGTTWPPASRCRRSSPIAVAARRASSRSPGSSS